MTPSGRRALSMRLEQLSHDRWSRRGVRVLLRALCGGLLICCFGVAGNIWLHWNISTYLIVIAMLVILLGGVAFFMRPRMSSDEVARRLDERFDLKERMQTALEVSAKGNNEGVAAYLLAQSEQIVRDVQRVSTTQSRVPYVWKELTSIVAVLLLLLGLMLYAYTQPAPVSALGALPGLVPPRDPNLPPEEPFDNPDGEQAKQDSQPDPRAAALLAEALRGESITRPAAELLTNGDAQGAAQSLRELADQTQSLSRRTRGDISQALRGASQKIDEFDSALSEKLDAIADQLEGEDAQAAQALEDLSAIIEAFKQSPSQVAEQEKEQQQGQQQPQQQPQQQQQALSPNARSQQEKLPVEQRIEPEQPERMNIAGKPMELNANGDGSASGDGSDGQDPKLAPTAQPVDPHNSESARIESADDPLRIPPDARDVVQNYFSTP